MGVNLSVSWAALFTDQLLYPARGSNSYVVLFFFKSSTILDPFLTSHRLLYYTHIVLVTLFHYGVL